MKTPIAQSSRNPRRLLSALAGVALLAGCTTVVPRAVNDSMPRDARKGYVDFIADDSTVVFTVEERDSSGKGVPVAKLYAGKGTQTGTYPPTSLPLANRVRYACSPGTHRFTVPISKPYAKQGNDPVEVPVKEGMVTPVKVFVGIIEHKWIKQTFRVAFEVADPIPLDQAK